ncbi:hypothetical protein IR083_20875 [Dysgonomonas sp. GY75]|uniref:hypothetical protein n=1 Tax=Dysgonomonas sp. GY75 TaxID=2780419 RepID=UPI0018846016|nr:hypothetical protein [Dysgonomonas sp. GY75]MBF0651276.1 hypothetical protein [Dysgonomonas sp. GY75]
MLRNETDVVNPGGGYGGGGWGGDGILGLIALLSIFRGNLFGGNYGEARNNLAEVENQLSNVRADIGDVKFDTVSSILNQTSSLLSAINDGRIENVSAILNQTSQLQSAICGLQQSVLNGQYNLGSAIANSAFENYKGQVGILMQNSDIAARAAQDSCATNLNITRLGYENQLSNERQTNELSRQISDCCCSTNLRMTELDYQGQLRDQANFAALLNGQTEIKCLIKDTAKDQEIARLTRESDRSFISNEINKSINTTVGSWAAARAFNGPTYPNPPYNGAWGF